MRAFPGLKILACLFAFAVLTTSARAQTPTQMSEAATLQGEHPAAYYKRAAAMFQAGQKDDATFVLYLGQLRYRAHLAARRAKLKPDGDPALFASLSEVVARPINEYAFGDVPALSRIIDSVIAYDRAHPDTFTPPARYAQAYRGVRTGLEQMRDVMLSQADEMRKRRFQNGLSNRN